MTVQNEAVHAGEFILSEGNGAISREQVVITGGNYPAGKVLGKVELGSAGAVADVGNTGDGAMGAITVGGEAQAGDYVLTLIEAAANAGDFQLVDPRGDVVGIGTVGQAFSGGGLSFTLADGAADFIVGDFITLTVAAGSGKYIEHDPAATDGSQNAVAVLYAAVDASAADQDGVITARLAEVNGDLLSWITGISAPDKAAGIAHLASQEIHVRT